MADKAVLYGFDGSTYVRTTRIILGDKNVESAGLVGTHAVSRDASKDGASSRVTINGIKAMP